MLSPDACGFVPSAILTGLADWLIRHKEARVTRLSNKMELDAGSFWRVLLSVKSEEDPLCLNCIDWTVCANPLFLSCCVVCADGTAGL